MVYLNTYTVIITCIVQLHTLNCVYDCLETSHDALNTLAYNNFNDTNF